MQLKDRERAFEERFAHDEELHFKIRAKRNKLAGLWGAAKLGKTNEESIQYADNLVLSLLNREQLRDRLIADFKAGNINVSTAEIVDKINELVTESRNHFIK